MVGMLLQGEQADSVKEYLTPFSQFLIPLYFITVGMRIPLVAMLDIHAWGLGLGLFVLALVGRLMCSQGIGRKEIAKGVDPWPGHVGNGPSRFARFGLRDSGARSSVAFRDLLLRAGADGHPDQSCGARGPLLAGKTGQPEKFQPSELFSPRTLESERDPGYVYRPAARTAAPRTESDGGRSRSARDFGLTKLQASLFDILVGLICAGPRFI